MKFNSDKLQEELREKRIIKKGMNVNEAAKEVGISRHQYRRAENYGGMDIEVFTKLVTWLRTNPADYYTGIIRPRLSTVDYTDIRRGLVIAMKHLAELGIDKPLSDRFEQLDNKILAQTQ